MNKDEFGFEVKLVFRKGISEKGFDSVTDEFIIEAIEKNGSLFGGGGGKDEYQGFVTLVNNNRNLDDSDIEKVRNWIDSKKEVLIYSEISGRKNVNE